jgi:hypothetical protein
MGGVYYCVECDEEPDNCECVRCDDCGMFPDDCECDDDNDDLRLDEDDDGPDDNLQELASLCEAFGLQQVAERLVALDNSVRTLMAAAKDDAGRITELQAQLAVLRAQREGGQ